jgi:hypothetical protein
VGYYDSEKSRDCWRDGAVNPRRIVEAFAGAKWSRPQGQDGRDFLVELKVNGVDERFLVAVPVSDSVPVTIAEYLGHSPTDQELEGIAKAKIIECVSNGFLDNWPHTVRCDLPSIHHTQVQGLIDEAKQRGYIR